MPDPSVLETLRGFQPYGDLPDPALGALAERARALRVRRRAF
ncbi:MAG TPA: hypothetical protein VMT18_15695 [Planctomycetota bacterium]|nr:hypothetical protein [Planctomycetota bacterium]